MNRSTGLLPGRSEKFIRNATSFQLVVRGGALQTRGMPSWDDLLSEAQVEQIRAHLVSVARNAYAKQQAGLSTAPPPDLKEGHQ